MIPPEVGSDPRMARSADNIAPAVAYGLREVVLPTFEKAEMAVETPIDREVLHGPRPAVPLARHCGRVARQFHLRRQQRHSEVSAGAGQLGVALVVLVDVDRKTPRQQGRPSGGAVLVHVQWGCYTKHAARRD